MKRFLRLCKLAKRISPLLTTVLLVIKIAAAIHWPMIIIVTGA